MPLTLLIPLVVFGLVSVTLALWFLLPSKPDKLHDPVAAWMREHPQSQVTDHLLDDTAQRALIITKDGDVGLVWSMGRHTTTRPLKDAKITQIPNGLRFHIPDFATQDITATLAEPANWMAVLPSEVPK